MKSREELVLKEVLPEWENIVQDFLRADAGEMLLGKLWRRVSGLEQGLISEDITTEAGVRKALEVRGQIRGLKMAIELITEKTHEQRTDRNTF